VKKWEALADGVSDAAAAIFLERKRPAEQQSPDWVARQQQKIENGLAAMNTSVHGGWCMGETFTLADIALGACLGYLDLRFPEIKWRERFSALDAVEKKLAERESRLLPAFLWRLPACFQSGRSAILKGAGASPWAKRSRIWR
jgi:glutathione S-transferase